jgi:hypothetical protein
MTTDRVLTKPAAHRFVEGRRHRGRFVFSCNARRVHTSVPYMDATAGASAPSDEALVQDAPLTTFCQKLSGTVATTHWTPREKTPSTNTNVASPKQVRAIVQNAAAIFPKASTMRFNKMRTIIERTASAVKTMAIFQFGKFCHDMLKAELI